MMRSTSWISLAPLVLVVLLFAGCGTTGDTSTTATTEEPPTTESIATTTAAPSTTSTTASTTSIPSVPYEEGPFDVTALEQALAFVQPDR